jgi:hypothetical protein
MTSHAHAQTMAAYDRWMNERLGALCAELSDEELCADFGELRRERERTDRDLSSRAAAPSDTRLAAPIPYTSFSNPEARVA